MIAAALKERPGYGSARQLKVDPLVREQAEGFGLVQGHADNPAAIARAAVVGILVVVFPEGINLRTTDPDRAAPGPAMQCLRHDDSVLRKVQASAGANHRGHEPIRERNILHTAQLIYHAEMRPKSPYNRKKRKMMVS